MYTLDGRQKRALHAALLAAFPRQAALERLVEFHLDTPLAVVAGEGPLADVVFRLLEWAEAQGRLDALVNGARDENPQNPQLIAFERLVLEARDTRPQDPALRQFAERVQLAPALPADPGLEQRVFRAGFADIAQWRARLGQAELAVCRIEAPAWRALGTGFLVGPDLVMTNRHVIEALAAQPAPPIVVRFDFKLTPDGAHLREGRAIGVAAQWLVASRPVADLDFALLRLAEPAGLQPPGGTAGAPPRGWLVPAYREMEADETIFVIQHPLGDALKLAAGPLVGRAAQRLQYRVDTEPGSSGSPCFTAQLELVALHRGAAEGVANQGVPFDCIMAALPPDVRTMLAVPAPAPASTSGAVTSVDGGSDHARQESLASPTPARMGSAHRAMAVAASAILVVALTGIVAWWQPWAGAATPASDTTSRPAVVRQQAVLFRWERLEATRGGCETEPGVTRALYRGVSQGAWPATGRRARDVQIVAFQEQVALEHVDAVAADSDQALAVVGTGVDPAVSRTVQFTRDVTVPVVVIACVRTRGEPPAEPPLHVSTWKEVSR